MTPNDIGSIGLTARGKATLDRLEESGWFASREAAAKLALGLAIREASRETGSEAGVEDGSAFDVEGSADTAWAVGNFDRDGEIRGLIETLYPGTQTPVRLMRRLIDEGLALLEERISKPGAVPADLLA